MKQLRLSLLLFALSLSDSHDLTLFASLAIIGNHLTPTPHLAFCAGQPADPLHWTVTKSKREKSIRLHVLSSIDRARSSSAFSRKVPLVVDMRSCAFGGMLPASESPERPLPLADIALHRATGQGRTSDRCVMQPR